MASNRDRVAKLIKLRQEVILQLKAASALEGGGGVWVDTMEGEKVISNYVLAAVMLEVDGSIQMLDSDER